MSIIISKDGKGAQRLNQTTIDQEDYLQQYIYNNPDAVPVYEIDEDIRLLILAREFGTASGPIDALGIDQHGNIYLIETKLYKNADKRTVVAQVLDYGASLWRSSVDFTEFTNQLEKHVTKQFGHSLSEQIQKFFNADTDGAGTILENMQTNLNNGTFKFVVLMDSLERRLKDLILFINHNSQFDVYAVELEYYKHQEFEIIIPRLYGAEVKKEVVGSRTSNQVLTPEEFWSALADSVPKEQFNVLKPFIEDLMKKGEARMGTASISLSFSQTGDKALTAFYKNGGMSLNFGHLAPDNREKLKALIQKYLPKIWEQPKFQREDLFKTYPSLTADEITENIGGLQKLFEELLA